ncbi:hypothetical protein NFI96_001805 [Prochilodus magdalenae]|nr:hypothetical protein NFI96_001805 [Prochilodus magdalenae]
MPVLRWTPELYIPSRALSSFPPLFHSQPPGGTQEYHSFQQVKEETGGAKWGANPHCYCLSLSLLPSSRNRNVALSHGYGSDMATSSTCQRLFTLETCCRYGYGPVLDLQPLELTRCWKNRDACQGLGPYLGANPFQGPLAFTYKRGLFLGPPVRVSGFFCATTADASQR